MAFKVIKNTAEIGDVDTVLSALVNGVTVKTLHNSGVTQIGSNRYIVYVVYE